MQHRQGEAGGRGEALPCLGGITVPLLQTSACGVVGADGVAPNSRLASTARALPHASITDSVQNCAEPLASLLLLAVFLCRPPTSTWTALPRVVQI